MIKLFVSIFTFITFVVMSIAEYTGDSNVALAALIMIILEIIIIIAIIVIMIKSPAILIETPLRRKVFINKSYQEGTIDIKNLKAFRDIPCDKNIYKSYYLCRTYNLTTNQNFLGVMILKWFKEKKITISQAINKTWFENKDIMTICLNNSAHFDNKYEKRLYKMLLRISKNTILEKHELEEWCKNNHQKLSKWFDDVYSYVQDIYEKEGHIKLKEEVSSNKYTIIKNREYIFDDYLKEEGTKLAGLKKYLNDFTKIDAKELKKVHLWDYYLMHAQLFGISNQMEQYFHNFDEDMTLQKKLIKDIEII